VLLAGKSSHAMLHVASARVAWIVIGPTHIWTTLEEYLIVFIVMQHLVGIDEMVSIICKF